MIKMNITKSAMLVAAALMLSVGANAQSKNTKPERMKTTEATQKDERAIDNGSTEKETKYKFVYSVVELAGEKGNYQIDFIPGTNEADKQRSQMNQRIALKMKSAGDSFTTETDVLNYFSEMGMELISVLPNQERGRGSKTLYFRTKEELK